MTNEEKTHIYQGLLDTLDIKTDQITLFGTDIFNMLYERVRYVYDRFLNNSDESEIVKEIEYIQNDIKNNLDIINAISGVLQSISSGSLEDLKK